MCIRDRITLKHDQNTFSVSFVNINFSNPDKWMFTWKLEGFDREWSRPTNQSVASYSNLDAGSYKLLVRVFNENEDVYKRQSNDRERCRSLLCRLRYRLSLRFY